ncbi:MULTISPECIES: ABC transporter substrate-binding protein [unclassified Meiothermus]|uniref:ABC transporter substrate-binding protein n=1 Tax=unclassified Meiothermus TaxID=370471 RepID=UPI000D7C77E2|nr:MULTISPECIES: extracellular solute-binding protein [unclassified Meiothermus]PZA07263.1 carbohydrate ABC transporter substrate-binding protein [Meiothermus sp. Pnk-1]RYM37997.1 carbohydrate ABC transporter substrate-binding protein [Meiothermus sp. PNK-Is4]
MRRQWIGFSLMGAALVALAAVFAQSPSVLFVSTQFTPIEEAQRMRQVILKDFSGRVEFIPEDNAPFTSRILSEAKTGRVNVSLVGGLHGDFPPLIAAGAMDTVDDVMAQLKERKFSPTFVGLGKMGTANQYYIPWMQATYIMVANKQALPYLPAKASLNTLTYSQLKEWGANLQRATGKRLLGFPAGPRGLMHRFTQGYLYPSYTKSAVSKFRSEEAENMWAEFKEIWQYVNPQATTYDFMQEPLLSGEVWVAWDHIARLRDALNQRPNDFVAFPAPIGPYGRGFMPVLAGLGIPKGAPSRAGAVALIEYLTRPEVQIATLVQNGFFPVIQIKLPDNLPQGTRMAADAIARQAQSNVALPSLLPVGLGAKGGEYNKVFQDTFARIILRGEEIRRVLDSEAVNLRRVMNDTKAPCWSPDPASEGPCPVN